MTHAWQMKYTLGVVFGTALQKQSTCLGPKFHTCSRCRACSEEGLRRGCSRRRRQWGDPGGGAVAPPGAGKQHMALGLVRLSVATCRFQEDD
eukprot:6187161-Alexandrium_andersonii.AAC.1